MRPIIYVIGKSYQFIDIKSILELFTNLAEIELGDEMTRYGEFSVRGRLLYPRRNARSKKKEISAIASPSPPPSPSYPRGAECVRWKQFFFHGIEHFPGPKKEEDLTT